MHRSIATRSTPEFFGTDYEPALTRERRRQARDARSADREGRAERRHRVRHAPRPDDGFEEYFAGSKLLDSLDAALALAPCDRNRALAKIVLDVDAGVAQDRDTGCECMAPDLSLLISLMGRDGVDEDTRQSALELAQALQRLAEHGGLDEGRQADLLAFSTRLQALPVLR